MSVLIKGMEMPKSCGYCKFKYLSMEGDECMFGVIETEYQKRPDDCPLVPVPKHGRLGDLDALAEVFRENAKEEWNKFAHPLNWADAFSDVADMVDDAPTIIPPSEEGK